MTSKVQNLLKYIGVASFSLATVNFGQTMISKRPLQEKYDWSVKQYMDLQNRFETLSQEKYSDFIQEKADLVDLKVKLELAKQNMEAASKAAKNLSNDPTNMSTGSIQSNTTTLNNSLDRAEENFKSITEWVNSKGGFKLTSDIDSKISAYKDQLWELVNSDNEIQLAATINLLGILIIFICLLSFIGIYSGNKLIEKFKWIEKYPRLKRFLELRLKFQQYYLMVDTTIVICILLTMFFVNLVLFSL